MKTEDYDKYYHKGGNYVIPTEIFNELLEEKQKYKEVIDKLEFIKNRAISGATQETINKLAIDFVNSYLIEVE